MDGVLIDSGAHHRHAWRALLAELGTEPADPEHWRLTIGRPSEEAIPLLLGRRMSGAEARRLARRKRDLYQERAQTGLAPVPGVPEFLASLARLGDELLRTRDGQFVLGRCVSAEEAARWKPREYARAARETFHLLAPLYRLR